MPAEDAETKKKTEEAAKAEAEEQKRAEEEKTKARAVEEERQKQEASAAERKAVEDEAARLREEQKKKERKLAPLEAKDEAGKFVTSANAMIVELDKVAEPLKYRANQKFTAENINQALNKSGEALQLSGTEIDVNAERLKKCTELLESGKMDELQILMDEIEKSQKAIGIERQDGTLTGLHGKIDEVLNLTGKAIEGKQNAERELPARSPRKSSVSVLLDAVPGVSL